ncbi:MAG: hypothetical protein KU28_07710 [Sulfurovum sp. PC08-66]|jgi:hypothetical protein|nr:MAG: hypothetical protein KU28_07710 [Sulfurovum sp. PC08-66]
MKILVLDSSGFIGKGYDTAHKLFGMRHFSNITLPKSQKLSANLYFFAPLLRLVIAFVWI